MRRFVEGADRGQTTLMPECLDDWVGLLVSVPAYSRFPDGLVGVPAREQIVYCLILMSEREP
jgi:hypothetical protein